MFGGAKKSKRSKKDPEEKNGYYYYILVDPKTEEPIMSESDTEHILTGGKKSTGPNPYNAARKGARILINKTLKKGDKSGSLTVAIKRRTPGTQAGKVYKYKATWKKSNKTIEVKNAAGKKVSFKRTMEIKLKSI